MSVLRQFWQGSRGTAAHVLTVWPILPPLLRWCQGNVLLLKMKLGTLCKARLDWCVSKKWYHFLCLRVLYKKKLTQVLVLTQINKVILTKGWRCLDCTLCEGCGKGSDEARLLLCDSCDISYHTYCLDPPLGHVPQGGWKCKW